MSRDPDDEYFSDGLAEELINLLAHVPGLKVTARTSSFAFRGKEQDIRRIAETLGVRTMLEGSVRRAGSRIRVTAQLINAEDGYHLWSERYDRELTDVFAIQDDIAQAIARALQLKLTAKPDRHTPTVPAYEALLKARHHCRAYLPEAHARAKEYCEQAIALDPAYAAPHALLGFNYLLATTHSGRPMREVAPLIRREALKALELDPFETDAHFLLGAVAAVHDYDWTEAGRQFQLAMASPSVPAEARWAYASLYLSVFGRFEESTAEMRRAVEQDPLTGICQARDCQARGLVVNRASGFSWRPGRFSTIHGLTPDPASPARPSLAGSRHTPLADAAAQLENRRMPVLRLALILALLAGIDSTNTQRASPDRPGTAADTPATDHAVGYYDERLQRVVLVGGAGDPKPGDRDKVWSWSGTRWERVTDEGPAGRVNASAAYDARRGRAVVTGGSRKADGGNWEVVGDSWEGDARGWRRIADVAPRDHHSLVEDGRGGILMFGGIPADRSGPWPADTWTLQGDAWKRLASDGPPARGRAALVYDRKRQRVVLFGGVSAPPGPKQPQTFFNDTWTWDGDRWHKAADERSARTIRPWDGLRRTRRRRPAL